MSSQIFLAFKEGILFMVSNCCLFFCFVFLNPSDFTTLMLSLDVFLGGVNVNNLAVLRGVCLMRPSATFCALTPVFEEALTPISSTRSSVVGTMYVARSLKGRADRKNEREGRRQAVHLSGRPGD